jgi:hypothetical protein
MDDLGDRAEEHQRPHVEDRHHDRHDQVGEREDAQHEEGDAEGNEPPSLGAEFRSRLWPETGSCSAHGHLRYADVTGLGIFSSPRRTGLESDPLYWTRGPGLLKYCSRIALADQ